MSLVLKNEVRNIGRKLDFAADWMMTEVSLKSWWWGIGENSSALLYLSALKCLVDSGSGTYKPPGILHHIKLSLPTGPRRSKQARDQESRFIPFLETVILKL